MNRRAIPLWALGGGLAVFGIARGCGAPPPDGPPTIREGKDECAACGMILNESRFAGALLIDPQGERPYLLFDDLGCMLNYEFEKGPALTPRAAWVRDYAGTGWISADAAAYLYADPAKVSTPMGSGILAFVQRSAAEAKQREIAGEILDRAGVRAARRRWMESRYGKPSDPR